MNKTLSLLCLSAALVASTSASSVTLAQFTAGPALLNLAPASFTFQVPSARSYIAVPLGSTLNLNNIGLALHGEISAVGNLTSIATAGPAFAQIQYAGTITVTAPSGSFVLPQSLTSAVYTIPPGGSVHFGPFGSGNNATAAGALADFYGPGNVPVEVSSAVFATLLGGANVGVKYGPGEGVFGLVTLSVTYDYDLGDVKVPEPKVYGMIGAVLSLGVLGYRQYRSRKV